MNASLRGFNHLKSRVEAKEDKEVSSYTILDIVSLLQKLLTNANFKRIEAKEDKEVTSYVI